MQECRCEEVLQDVCKGTLHRENPDADEAEMQRKQKYRGSMRGYPDWKKQLQLQVVLPGPRKDAVWTGYVDVEVLRVQRSQALSVCSDDATDSACAVKWKRRRVSSAHEAAARRCSSDGTNNGSGEVSSKVR